MEDWQIVESVYKYTAILYECNWKALRDMKEPKHLLIHVLCQYLERELVAEMFGLQESSITGNYLTNAERMIRQDSKFSDKVRFVKRNCNIVFKGLAA